MVNHPLVKPSAGRRRCSGGRKQPTTSRSVRDLLERTGMVARSESPGAARTSWTRTRCTTNRITRGLRSAPRPPPSPLKDELVRVVCYIDISPPALAGAWAESPASSPLHELCMGRWLYPRTSFIAEQWSPRWSRKCRYHASSSETRSNMPRDLLRPRAILGERPIGSVASPAIMRPLFPQEVRRQ